MYTPKTKILPKNLIVNNWFMLVLAETFSLSNTF